jgi:hypothetical protein
LFFERVRKWNGLLIEGDPSNYAELKKKNRKAFSINACLSPRKTAAKVNWIPFLHLKLHIPHRIHPPRMHDQNIIKVYAKNNYNLIQTMF